MQCTHVAYSDESFYNRGRYRSIAIVTLKAHSSAPFGQAVFELLDGSGVKEFKWQKLRQARERFAAQKLVDFVIGKALRGVLRVDVLTWDTEDSRHRIKGRDDTANLQRMYHHLFKNALKRWPGDNTWILHPDENSSLDWGTVQDYLYMAGLSSVSAEEQTPSLFRIHLSHEFHIQAVQEVDSKQATLCQVADLFAGLSVFSRLKYDTYCCWQNKQQKQLQLLPPEQPMQLSNSDQERSVVLAHFNNRCKAHKLGVSLQTTRGLWTPHPADPINFWLYKPQHLEDKAPTRS